MKEKVYLVFCSSRGSKDLVFVGSSLPDAVDFVSLCLSAYAPDYVGPKCTFRVYEQVVNSYVYLQNAISFLNVSTTLVYHADTSGFVRYYDNGSSL